MAVAEPPVYGPASARRGGNANQLVMIVCQGFNLVLNADKANLDLSGVVFTKNVPDITDKVLALLNSDTAKPATNAVAPNKSRP